MAGSILIVDDDESIREALQLTLQLQGFVSAVAEDGRAALAWLESNQCPCLILVDLMMPVMDGFETMQVIRRDPAFQRLPIIALTAKAMKGDRERCLDAGASDYLAKPVNTEQLLSALRIWLHR